ncbi:MAG: DUF5076 domain-containing protein [Gemmataceae bacterium]
MSEPHTPPDGDVEIARAWLSGDTLGCSVRAGVFEEPALWGAVLADLARFVAVGLQQEEGKDPADTLRQIREAFGRELDAGPGGRGDEVPNSEPEGQS